LIQPTMAFSLAFDHVPLDQRELCRNQGLSERPVCFPFLSEQLSLSCLYFGCLAWFDEDLAR
jgi:hypothetical protein